MYTRGRVRTILDAPRRIFRSRPGRSSGGTEEISMVGRLLRAGAPWLLFLVLAPPAFAGPNRSGALIVHVNPSITYEESHASYCGASGVTTCADVQTRVDSARVVVCYVLAAFPERSSPRLKGVSFGVSYDPSVVIRASGPCGDFDLPDESWPASGKGTAVAWNTAQTSIMTEVYWFAAYTYAGEGAALTTIPHPRQGGWFADDRIPSLLDRVAAYGSLGFYRAGELSCPDPLDPHGACCHEDGTCTVTLPTDCSGTFRGYESICSPNPCPQPRGACCNWAGSCRIGSALSCGDEFQGVGTTCSPNPCPPPIGACCSRDGACVVVTQEECAGIYQGHRTGCDPTPCEPPGGCCLVSGDCVQIAESLCAQRGGTFFGVGSPCDAAPCATRGACCTEGDCILSTHDLCIAELGVYHGDGIPCGPYACLAPLPTDCLGGGFCGTEPASGVAWDEAQSIDTEDGHLWNTMGFACTGADQIHSDGSYERGIAWSYDGAAAPTAGAFAERFIGAGVVCGAMFDFTQVGNQDRKSMDIFVWEDQGGCPGRVLCMQTGVNPGPTAWAPIYFRHRLYLPDCTVGDAWWVGFWGNWPGAKAGWYLGADMNGPGGCPATFIAPGIGYPAGWARASQIDAFGSVRALGIGVEMRRSFTPVQKTTWGQIKSLMRDR